jgi:hypothetical protein
MFDTNKITITEKIVRLPKFVNKNELKTNNDNNNTNNSNNNNTNSNNNNYGMQSQQRQTISPIRISSRRHPPPVPNQFARTNLARAVLPRLISHTRNNRTPNFLVDELNHVDDSDTSNLFVATSINMDASLGSGSFKSKSNVENNLSFSLLTNNNTVLNTINNTTGALPTTSTSKILLQNNNNNKELQEVDENNQKNFTTSNFELIESNDLLLNNEEDRLGITKQHRKRKSSKSLKSSSSQRHSSNVNAKKRDEYELAEYLMIDCYDSINNKPTTSSKAMSNLNESNMIEMTSSMPLNQSKPTQLILLFLIKLKIEIIDVLFFVIIISFSNSVSFFVLFTN